MPCIWKYNFKMPNSVNNRVHLINKTKQFTIKLRSHFHFCQSLTSSFNVELFRWLKEHLVSWPTSRRYVFEYVFLRGLPDWTSSHTLYIWILEKNRITFLERRIPTTTKNLTCICIPRAFSCGDSNVPFVEISLRTDYKSMENLGHEFSYEYEVATAVWMFYRDIVDSKNHWSQCAITNVDLGTSLG